MDSYNIEASVFRRFITRTVILGAVAGFLSPAASNGEDLKSLAERFLRYPMFRNLSVSPDGSHLAFLGYHEDRTTLNTFNVEENELRSFTGLPGQRVYSYSWVDDDNLIFGISPTARPELETWGRIYHSGLGTADEDITRVIPLAEEKDLSLLSGARNRPLEVLTVESRQGVKYPDVLSLDIRHNSSQTIVNNPGKVVDWMHDVSGTVRLGTVLTEKSEWHYLHRFAADSPWERLDLPDRAYVLAFDSAGTSLYVCRPEGERKTGSLYLYDLREERFSEASESDPVYDICADAVLSMRYHVISFLRDQKHDSVIGFRYHREKPSVVYFDKTYRDLQRKLNTALRGTDVRILGFTERGHFVVEQESDTIPPTCYLLDPKSGKMTPFFKSRSWIDSNELSKMRPVSFPSRDGTTIYGYLTLPKGGGSSPFPLIMTVRGGLHTREVWGFDPEIQFFAKLGYAVFQVNHRGSSGYGEIYEAKNLIEVCRYVVEDVADAARWAIDEGYADGERVAIYGGGFGGYAALAGAAHVPDLYRCAVGFAGVYDWNMQLKDERRSWWLKFIKFHWMSDFYLDLEKYREGYAAVSPRYSAGSISAPVLLIHGGSDNTVSAQQAKVMAAALRKARKPVEVAIFDWGVHGFLDAESRIKHYIKVAEFLEKHMK